VEPEPAPSPEPEPSAVEPEPTAPEPEPTAQEPEPTVNPEPSVVLENPEPEQVVIPTGDGDDATNAPACTCVLGGDSDGGDPTVAMVALGALALAGVRRRRR
jgi:MYXO-CTERM domain-containing protein